MKSKRHLQEALRSEGLPWGYNTLLRYEKAGIIPRPKNVILTASGELRLYSDEEIKEIVSRVRAYKDESIQV